MSALIDKNHKQNHVLHPWDTDTYMPNGHRTQCFLFCPTEVFMTDPCMLWEWETMCALLSLMQLQLDLSWLVLGDRTLVLCIISRNPNTTETQKCFLYILHTG